MITLGNKATGQAGASSVSFSLVVAAGNDSYLMVAATMEFSGVTISSVTFNGVALTKIDGGVDNNEVRAELWGIKKPDVTTANVVITCSAASNIIGMAQVFYGVDQANPINAHNNSNAATGNASVNITPTIDNNVIVDALASGEAAGTISPNASQTSIYTNESTPFDAGMSYKRQTTAAATSMSWTITSGARWAQAAASLSPSIAGGAFLYQMI